MSDRKMMPCDDHPELDELLDKIARNPRNLTEEELRAQRDSWARQDKD